MKITSYSFGKISIDNQAFTSDLKIIRGDVKPNWWRKEGHRLQIDDIRDITEAKPEILVVGTGYSGLMRLSDGLREELGKLGIEIEALPSGKAVERFNNLVEKLGEQKVALAIHLTC
jgi:hypothetical protein